jgi:hypothetical protein
MSMSPGLVDWALRLILPPSNILRLLALALHLVLRLHLHLRLLLHQHQQLRQGPLQHRVLAPRRTRARDFTPGDQ